MILFIIFVVILSIVEIVMMKKKKLKKEIILYCILAIITLVYGIFYFKNPYSYSFAEMVINLFK